MGYALHHVIIVIGADMGSRDWMAEAHERASAIGLRPTPLVRAPINAYRSFMVPPDGSNEGWAESDEGNEKRVAFVNWLDDARYEDGSTPLKWAEVAIGDDSECETEVTDSWQDIGEAAGDAESEAGPAPPPEGAR